MAEMRNPYGSIVRDERLRQKIGLDSMAVRCMMSPEGLSAVEDGNRWFSEAELRLASAALSLNKNSLLRGERAERTKTEAIRDLLAEFYKDLRELTFLQESILKKITEISTWQRFTIDQIRKGKADSETYEPVQYAIFDNDRGDYVRDENGGIVFFKSASEAFEKAEEMEEAVRIKNAVGLENDERKAVSRLEKVESVKEAEGVPSRSIKGNASPDNASSDNAPSDNALSEKNTLSDNSLSEMIDDTLTGNDLEDEDLEETEPHMNIPRL